MEDCEIYMIKCLANNKYYIGKALKHVGAFKSTWGTQGRWLSHVREAENSFDKKRKGHCVLLNAAILKYGTQSFEVKKICDCMSNDADDLEQKYINEYNSMVPYGYNLKTGGNKGKDSENTREKKRLMRLGQKHSESTKEAISKGQLGNKRNQKSKYIEDHSLPKYIICNRIGEEKIGYSVSKYPIDKLNKEYVTKEFLKSDNMSLEQCLEEAKKYLDVLDKQQSINKIIEPKPIKSERTARTSKLGSDKYDMPKYISLLKLKGIEVGFNVDGIRVVNEDGSIYRYRKKFNATKYSMEEKLNQAKEHLEYVKNNFTCILD